MKLSRRRVLTIAAVMAVVLVAAFLARRPLGAFVLERGISLATGYDVRFGDYRLGREHGAFFDVHVRKNGDPVLDVARVDVSYQLRDIFPGGEHRFGFAALDMTGPIFTLLRHKDGSYNFTRGGTSASAPGATKQAAAPYFFTLKARDGAIRLVDQAPLEPDLHEQEINRVDVDASIKSNARTTARITGMLIGRRAQGNVVRRWPLSIRSIVDYDRGFAIHRVRAPALPLRGALNYFIHSPAFRVDDGIARNVDVKAYAVDIRADRPFDYRLGGGLRIEDGRLVVSALQRPVRAVRGTLDLYDNGFTTRRVDGMLAGTPIVARGAIYDWDALAFRLGVSGDGELLALRKIFGFSEAQPVGGTVHVETLLEARIENPLVRTAFAVPRGAYAGVPFGDAAGMIDYYDGAVVLGGLRARYGALAVRGGGRFLIGERDVDTNVALRASGPARALPYGENLAPEAAIDALALVSGINTFRARGAIAANGPGVEGSGFFRVDDKGVGEFGPFAFARSDGSSLIGALRYERPTSSSAGWVDARGYRLEAPVKPARLPGVELPAFPPIAGIVNGALAGGGTPSSFALAGAVDGRELRIAQYAIGSGSARLGGTLENVQIADIRVRGPLGAFDGAGVAANGTFALRGDYDGSLEALAPLTLERDARGGVRGPVALTIDEKRTVVQTTGATLAKARIRGVAIDRAAGTVTLDGKALHVIAAEGEIGGQRAVAAESAGTIAVSAPDLPAGALRDTGIPLEAGAVSIFGRADLRAHDPRFNGTVAVAHGRASGFAVAGDAAIALDGPVAVITNGTGALGETYGTFAGRLDGIGARALRYDLDAGVALGDIGLLRRDIHLPVKYLDGSFAARLRLRGSGARPRVDGDVRAPEGSLNGLAFRDGAGHVAIDPSGIAAHDATITVGSTRSVLDASVGLRALSVSVNADAANLADFNDYFDASDTLAGKGRVKLTFVTDGNRIRTSGAVALRDFRYRSFPFGATDARWGMTAADAIRAHVDVRGKAGALASDATIQPNGGDPTTAFTTGRYAGTAGLGAIDLGTWLPAVGILTPVLGTVDARARFDGRFPRLALGGDATLRNGTVAGMPVIDAHLRATAQNGRVAIAGSSANLGFAQITASGSFSLAQNEPLALNVHASAPDVGRAAHAVYPPSRGVDVSGTLDADMRIGGTLARPRVDGGFDVEQGRFRTLAVPRAIGVLSLDGKAFVLRDAEVVFPKGAVFVAGSLPLQLQPFAIGPQAAPLSFDVAARALDLAQFGPFFPAGTTLGGVVDGRFGVEGTVRSPRLLGTLALANGSYVSALERAPIQNVDARLSFAGTSVALEAFHAGVGGGTLDGSGRLDLPFPNTPKAGYAVELRANAARLDFPAYGRGRVDGNLRLTSEPERPLLSGGVALSDAVIPFAALYRSGGPSGGLSEGGGNGFDLGFDIRASAGRNVRVRSAILDIGATGAVALTGTLASPRLAGAFSSTGGTFSTYNRAFRVQQATVTFDPVAGVVPDIDLRATAHVTNPDPDPTRNIAGSADITVNVTGPADNFHVSYQSNPPYTEAQIAGLLLDVPAILGAVNFNSGPGGTLLRGAPGESNVLLPPGVSPEQTGTISFSQEAFSILNGQITQRAFAPIERIFEHVFGLSDLALTIDYSGGIGYNARRRLGHRDFYATLGQTLSYPERTNIGFELRPDAVTTANFTYFKQNGVTSLITTDTPGATVAAGNRRFTSVQPLGNRQGFTFTLTRKYP